MRTELAFDSYHAKHPGMPRALRRRLHDERVMRNRLRLLRTSYDEMMATWLLHRDRNDSGVHPPGHLRKHRQRPHSRRTWLRWDSDDGETSDLVLAKRGELGRPTKPGNWWHELTDQIDLMHDDDFSDLVDWLVSEGWPRRNHA